MPRVSTADDPARVAGQIAEALYSHGMVVLAGSGLASLGQQLLRCGRDAFEWVDGDPVIRQQVEADPAGGRHLGYSPIGREALAADGGRALAADLRRSWTWTTSPPDAPWQHLPPVFRGTAMRWTDAALDLLARHFLPGLSELLDRDLGGYYGPLRAVCRLHDYPALDARTRPGLLRAGAHVDDPPITLLMPDGPGLQLSHRRRWRDVPYEPGDVVVNVGAELAALAGLLGGPVTIDPARHRVTARPGAARRTSVALFAYGAPDTIVTTAPDGTPVTSEQFMQARAATRTTTHPDPGTGSVR